MSSSSKEEFIYRVSYILTQGRGKNRKDTPIVADWLYNEYSEKFALKDLEETIDFVATRASIEGYEFNLVDINLLRSY